jgi:hypothetical protein
MLPDGRARAATAEAVDQVVYADIFVHTELSNDPMCPPDHINDGIVKPLTEDRRGQPHLDSIVEVVENLIDDLREPLDPVVIRMNNRSSVRRSGVGKRALVAFAGRYDAHGRVTVPKQNGRIRKPVIGVVIQEGSGVEYCSVDGVVEDESVPFIGMLAPIRDNVEGHTRKTDWK